MQHKKRVSFAGFFVYALVAIKKPLLVKRPDFLGGSTSSTRHRAGTVVQVISAIPEVRSAIRQHALQFNRLVGRTRVRRTAAARERLTTKGERS